MDKKRLKNSQLRFKQVQDIDDLKRRAMTIGFYGVLSIAGYKFLLQPAYRKYKMNNEQRNILSDPNKQQATYLYNAMNPSGISWMRSFDNTNEETVYSAARRITNWNAVQSTYGNLYNRNLLSDLQKELDNDEYQTFLRILSTTASGKTSNKSNAIARGLIIASSKDVRLRSTPDSTKKSYSIGTNVLGTARANSFLGWTTGRQHVDNRGVKYIQLMISFKKLIPISAFRVASIQQKSKTISFWVGSGAIYKFKEYQQLNEAGIKLWRDLSDMGLRKNYK